MQTFQLEHAPSSNEWDLEVAKVFQHTTHSLQRMSSSLETNIAMPLEIPEDLGTQLSAAQTLRPQSFEDMDYLSSCDFYEVSDNFSLAS